MATENAKQVAIRNIWTDNQVLRQILGICSSLAVTNRMQNSLVMGLGVSSQRRCRASRCRPSETTSPAGSG